MRLISFAMTTEAMVARRKTVTRRLGWRTLQPDTVLGAIEKGQGLGRGGRVVHLYPILVLSVRLEPLEAITAPDVIREGFPDMTPAEFVAMFRRHQPHVGPVTRIEFAEFDAATASRIVRPCLACRGSGRFRDEPCDCGSSS